MDRKGAWRLQRWTAFSPSSSGKERCERFPEGASVSVASRAVTVVIAASGGLELLEAAW